MPDVYTTSLGDETFHEPPSIDTSASDSIFNALDSNADLESTLSIPSETDYNVERIVNSLVNDNGDESLTEPISNPTDEFVVDLSTENLSSEVVPGNSSTATQPTEHLPTIEFNADLIRGPPAEGESHSTIAGDVIVIEGNSADIDTTPNVDVDTNGDGQADLLGATLETWAFDVAETLTLQLPSISTTLSLIGEFAIAWITPNGASDARYTALKMGDVTVSSSSTTGDFGFTGTMDIDSLDYNSAAGEFDRLDWNTAFDFDGDGNHDTLNPGADLASTPDLTIDYTRDFIHRITGTVTGNGPDGAFITAGDVTVAGATDFASTRHLTNQVASLTDATLDSLAINAVSSVDLSITGVADLSLTGQLAVVRITPDGETDARYTAVKMGDVTVTASTNSANFGLTGTMDIDSLDYNSAAGEFDRLDWTKTFDSDGDGNYDTLDPGADLPTPVDLTIDYTRDFIHRITGTVTGNGPDGAFITAGDVTVAGATDFASTRYLTNQVASLTDATLDSLAINAVSSVDLSITGVADLSLTGQLAVVRITPDGETDARYTAVKMGDVTVTVDTST
ncbi:MAG: hypothetical protein VX738_15715, partial [Planctomycetota bacterium]|nr:hypothetical protein [Planctomycetota bacterium]